MDRQLSLDGVAFYEWLRMKGCIPGRTRQDLCLLYFIRELLDANCYHDYLDEKLAEGLHGAAAMIARGNRFLNS
jgi:hypothetical protein